MNTEVENSAWAAGLFEAEGCCVAGHVVRRGKRYNYSQLQVTSTDQDVINKLHAFAGVGGVYHHASKDVTRQDAWRWCLTKRADLRKFLPEIYPYLGKRRAVAAGAMLAALGIEPRSLIKEDVLTAARRWSGRQVAWMAGLIEGDGSIARNERYWQLRLSTTDHDTARRLQSVIGAGGVYDHSPAIGNRKRVWQYALYRQVPLYAILSAIFPHLCSRRKGRALEALTEMGAAPPWRDAVRPAVIGVMKTGAINEDAVVASAWS